MNYLAEGKKGGECPLKADAITAKKGAVGK